MAESHALNITPGALKQLNKGRKRRLNVESWSDIARKISRNAGKQYVGRNGVHRRAKVAPNTVRGITLYRPI